MALSTAVGYFCKHILITQPRDDTDVWKDKIKKYATAKQHGCVAILHVTFLCRLINHNNCDYNDMHPLPIMCIRLLAVQKWWSVLSMYTEMSCLMCNLQKFFQRLILATRSVTSFPDSWQAITVVVCKRWHGAPALPGIPALTGWVSTDWYIIALARCSALRR